MGNVLTVLSDKKTGRPKAGDPSMISIYDFDMVTAADYTPFGMVMLGRNFSFLSRYRYGFNGKEMDNEVKGAGNLLDYGNRLYDPLVGRFLSVDPLTSQYPGLTPYQYASNSPISGVDLDGKEFFYHDPLAGFRLLKGMFLGWASDFSNGALKTREGVAQLGLAKHQQASYNNPSVPQHVQNRLNQNDKIAGANSIVEGTTQMVQASADAATLIAPAGEGISAGKNATRALGTVIEKKVLSGAEKVANSMANNAAQMSEKALVKSGNEAVTILKDEISNLPANLRYPGVVADYYTQTANQLRRTIRSTQKTITQHEEWIKNPLQKPGLTQEKWNKMSGRAKEGLLNKWQEDINRNKAYLDIAQEALKSKQN